MSEDQPNPKRHKPENTLPLAHTLPSHILQRKVFDLVPNANTKYNKLPGPLPTTLARKHIKQNLKEHNYYVAEKSDGVRNLLLFVPSDNTAVLIDRVWNQTPLSLKLVEALKHTLGTDGPSLLDGELLHTLYDPAPVFLFYDLACLNGDTSIAGKKFSERLKVMTTEIGPAIAKIQQAQSEPFGLILQSKLFVPCLELERISRKIFKKDNGEYEFYDQGRNRRNGNDGLIFIRDDDNFIPTTKDSLLKWKPTSKNTVDFKIKQDRINGNEIELVCGGYNKSDITVRKQEVSDEILARIMGDFRSLQAHSLVYECQYDCDASCWKILHLRHDKNEPNFVTIVFSTLETMVENISMEELVEFGRHLFALRQKRKST